MPRSMCDYILMTASREDFSEQKVASVEIAAHLETCAACREAVQRKIAIQNLIERTEMDPIAARRLTVRVLSAEKRLWTGQGKERRFLRLVWMSAAVAATAALAIVLTVSFFPTSDAAIVGESPAIIGTHDTTLPDSKDVRDRQPLKKVAAVSEPKTIVMKQGAKVWMKRNTEVSVISDTSKLARTRVKRGRIVVDISKKTPGFRFVVHTPTAEVESLGTVFSVEVLDNGSEIIRVAKSAVMVRPNSGAESVVVRAGEELVLGAANPEIADKDAIAVDLCLVRGDCPSSETVDEDDSVYEAAFIEPEPEQVSDGPERKRERGLAGRNGRKTPTNETGADAIIERIDTAIASGQLESAERLIKQWSEQDGDAKLKRLIRLANGFRNARRFKQAVSVYEQIFSAYPGRDAAINGLVSMGQIKQGILGDSAGAAYYFERYLKKRPRGSLAEAASAGRVRALFSLKQWGDVVDASDQYMKLYNGGLSHREVLQKRRRALEKLGKN